ncbi:MAG: hypothetical protein D6814_03500 [Calditrichaeota bacterium]|nr:MAG: hypothetical protein D6814_03500 [Calditrichota bacterium]
MKCNRSTKLFAGALILAHVLLISCQNNPVSGKKEQPVLPPTESLSIDMSLFDQTPGAGKASQVTPPGKNFSNAAIRALVINAVVLVILALPAGTLALAVSQQPKLGDDGKFHWTFNYADNGVVLQADLAGWIDVENQQSAWEMRITNSKSNPPLDKFLWYSGRAALDNTSGFWDIYDPTQPNAQVKVLRADWTHPASDKATLDLTVVKPNVQENGDHVSYAADGDTRTMSFFDQSKGTTIEIGWDATTHAGYLIAPDYNGGAKSCWDQFLQDTDCPGS